jgi:gliding motility associated protien GldN
MKKLLFLLNGFIFASLGALAQVDPNVNAQPEFLKATENWKPSLEVDGAVDKVPHRTFVAPWTSIRENDILYKKRVWRMIDVFQKKNAAFRYPGDEESGGGYFIEMLLWGVRNGELKSYDAGDDRFTSEVKYEDILTKLTGRPDTIEVTNPVTGEVTISYSRRDFVPTDVTKFKIKEDVIFDRNLGREVKRIIGICPVLDRYDDEGRFKGSQSLFWIYYPKARNVLAKYQVYSPDNDVFRITWDDFFEKRLFNSYITKSTMNNFTDDDIRVYKNGVDKLNESEKVREALFNKEHDLWVY